MPSHLLGMVPPSVMESHQRLKPTLTMVLDRKTVNTTRELISRFRKALKRELRAEGAQTLKLNHVMTLLLPQYQGAITTSSFSVHRRPVITHWSTLRPLKHSMIHRKLTEWSLTYVKTRLVPYILRYYNILYCLHLDKGGLQCFYRFI